LSATIVTPPTIRFPTIESDQFAELTRIIGEIDEFKGHWRRLGEIRAERLASLRQVTTVESAGSSTRIEGAQLSDDEVGRLLQGLHVDSFRARDEAEVLGYAELLQTIFDSYREIPLTENYIKQLHKILLGRSEKDEWHRGQYKKHENNVEAHHPDGRVEVVFRTASPFDTPRMMAELVRATNDALESSVIHPLICLAYFLVEFLAIHPFQDGNGRLSRALTALLMLRTGYEYVPYASMERVIEENKPQYYLALRTSQADMERDPSRFAPWLMFFLRTLQSQKRVLEGKLEIERSIIRLSDAQRRAIELIESQGRSTTAQIAKALGIPARSARYHLDMLVGRGLIEAHGERRGRYYTRSIGTTTGTRSDQQSRNGAVLAVILERGGSVTREELNRVLDEQGFDHHMAGALHGRRLAHLRRDPKTGRSLLTTRGKEIAEQFLFARRLARGAMSQEEDNAPQPRRR
jgi:Fic family protein